MPGELGLTDWSCGWLLWAGVPKGLCAGAVLVGCLKLKLVQDGQS